MSRQTDNAWEMKMTTGSNQQATEKANSPRRRADENNNRENIIRKRRGAISSEPLGDKPVGSITNVPKSGETQQRLQQALQKNILFSHLEEDERNNVFAAMFEVNYKAGDVIIRQGDKGDNFYVVDVGQCDIYVNQDNGQPPLHVMDVYEGGSFGELALIYGSPRAATVIARTDCRLWAIDRISYRTILMDTTMKKRRLYEEFLEHVSILKHLEKYERVSLADALEPCTFQNGEVIVKEGDSGDKSYIIVEGEVKVTKKKGDTEEEVSRRLHSGDYFGEIALLLDRPRAATVTSVGVTKCVEMDRQRFNRLLGPCEDILRRNMEMYNQFMTSKA